MVEDTYFEVSLQMNNSDCYDQLYDNSINIINAVYWNVGFRLREVNE